MAGEQREAARRFEGTGPQPETEDINIIALEPGTKVLLAGGATAEVVANPRDGMWVLVRYLSSPTDPAQVGQEDLVICYDFVRVLERP